MAIPDSTSPTEERAAENLLPRLTALTPEEFGAHGSGIVDAIRRKLGLPPGDVPEFMATFLRHPELVQAHTELALQLFNGALPPRDRELAVLRMLWLCQSPFEWSVHLDVSKTVGGLTGEDVERVIIGPDAEGWDDRSRAIVRAVDSFHSSATISDKVWKELSRFLSDRQLIELPILIGQYQGLCYLANACRFRLPAGGLGLAAR